MRTEGHELARLKGHVVPRWSHDSWTLGLKDFAGFQGRECTRSRIKNQSFFGLHRSNTGSNKKVVENDYKFVILYLGRVYKNELQFLRLKI